MSSSTNHPDTSHPESDYLEIMARSIGHELRTPLCAIKSGIYGVKEFVPVLVATYREALAQGLDVPEIPPKYLDMLSNALDLVERAAFCASSHVNMFINNLSQLDINKLSLQAISISACLEQAVNQYPYKTIAQKSTLVNAIANVEEFLLLGNMALMINLLLNLFKNAMYYIQDAGRGEIVIWTKLSHDTNYLYIRNTPTSISEDELEHIFNPFYGTKRHSMGMGLYFCKQLMNALKGDITCYSKVDAYTEFLMSFPACN